MSDSNSQDSIPFEGPALRGLSELKPVGASHLQAAVFYRAGYEAAATEFRNRNRQKVSLLYASAASVLLAIAAGGLGFRLGTQRGHPIAAASSATKTEHETAPETQPKTENASQTFETNFSEVRSDALVETATIPWKSEVGRWLPIQRLAIPLVGRGIEPGAIGADWDSIVVTQSKYRPAMTASPSTEPLVPSKPQPQSLRSLRESQIRSLMNNTF